MMEDDPDNNIQSSNHRVPFDSKSSRSVVFLELWDVVEHARDSLPSIDRETRRALSRSRRTIKDCFALAEEHPIADILEARKAVLRLESHLLDLLGGSALDDNLQTSLRHLKELTLLCPAQTLATGSDGSPVTPQAVPQDTPIPVPDIQGLLARHETQQRFSPVSAFQRFQLPQPPEAPSWGHDAPNRRQSSLYQRTPQRFSGVRRSSPEPGLDPPQQNHGGHSFHAARVKRQRTSREEEFKNSAVSIPSSDHSSWRGDRVHADGETLDPPEGGSSFISGSRKLLQDMAAKKGGRPMRGNRYQSGGQSGGDLGGVAGTVTRAVLGGRRRRRFQPPRPLGGGGDGGHRSSSRSSSGEDGPGRPSRGSGSRSPPQDQQVGNRDGDQKYPNTEKGRLIQFCVEEKGMEEKLVETIVNDMCDDSAAVTWDDIAGLEDAKQAIKEIIVWPLQRPDLFSGLRGPPKGILLYGPPGTGKTLIGKAIAYESKAKFFAVSASSLTSKWHGEGEKLVKTLIAVATVCQPSIIFIDEIDALLSKRQDSEFEATRRIKTEFLVQLDGARTGDDDRVVVVGATNRPQELDEAARRRLSKRLYIPLPEPVARKRLVQHLLRDQKHSLTEEHFDEICKNTRGYSGADLKLLCTEAAFGPIRSLGHDITQIDSDKVRPISAEDFREALRAVRASVSPSELKHYLDWNDQYGTFKTPPLEEGLEVEM